MKPLQSPQKKKILDQLGSQFGITELPYLLLQFGKEKIRLYSGDLSKEELMFLDKNLRVENIGLYFASHTNTDDLRLTLDGTQLFKKQISQNILDIDDRQADFWLRGNDLDIKTDSNFKIIRDNDELLGCGKSTGDRITNLIPKERRIK